MFDSGTAVADLSVRLREVLSQSLLLVHCSISKHYFLLLLK